MALNIFERVKDNLIDLFLFGPQFLLRHLARASGHSTARVNIPGYGMIQIRPAESDVRVLRQVFRDEQYRIPKGPVNDRIQLRYEQIVHSNKTPVVVDAGANIGSASLWFLERFSNAVVVAVEPEPGNLSVLRKNAESWPRLMVLEAAIGSSDGFVSIQGEATGWGARTQRTENGIPVVTMRKAFDRVPDGCPFIAKIDIEGFENDLFSKNTEWINDVHVIYIEPHDWMIPGEMTSRSFQQAMAQHAFELFISGENLVYVRA